MWVSTVTGILTYHGNEKDCVINYTLLPIDLIPIILILNYVPKQLESFKFFWIPLTLGLFAYQILLCVFVGCSGISIVWSSYAGFFWYFLWKGIPKYGDSQDFVWPFWKIPVIISSIFTLIVLGYYAAVEEALTSIAHVCAIVLGWLIALAVRNRMDRKMDQNPPLLPVEEAEKM